MYYRLTVRRQDFHYEEFFAAKKPPTQRQLIRYYSNPDRVFGEADNMIQKVKTLLESVRCNFPILRKNVVSGHSFDDKGSKYIIVVERLDIVPLSDVLDGKD